MFNCRVGSAIPEIISKLEERLAEAKRKLLEVKAINKGKAAQWTAARRVYDIEMEIDAWRRIQ